MTDDLKPLAEQIAATLLARLPIAEGLWSGEQIAAYLNVSPRQAKERITLLPDFPRAIRIPGAGSARIKRWKPDEVIEWAERLQDKRRAA